MKIEIKPRLHITLLSLSDGTYRKNGGIGFCIDEPSTTISLAPASAMSLVDSRSRPMSTEDLLRLDSKLRSVILKMGLSDAYSFEIYGNSITHHGFGSGTGIALAAIELLLKANALSYNQEMLVRISGRGGTSGIGIHTYFEGGFIFDLGRHGGSGEFGPSGVIDVHESPMLLGRLDMPDWRIGLCIPLSMEKNTESEQTFFKKTLPISISASAEATFHALFGTYTAIRTNDQIQFSKSIRAIQRTAWKAAEWAQYGNKLLELEADLYSAGADCVGMTSLGPALFFLAHDAQAVMNRVKPKFHEDVIMLCANTSNSGRTFHA